MNTSCPICFDILEGKSLATTNVCNHTFCLQCLQTWSKHGNVCPVDRKKFKKIISLDSETAIKVKPRKRKFPRAFYDITVYCEVCKNSTGASTLLLCDSCDLGYHLNCLSPPLKVIPSGRWYCPECVAVELRLRTNVATPADTKYAKHVRKKRKKFKKKSRTGKVTSLRQNVRDKRTSYSQLRQRSRKVVSSTLTKIRHCLKKDEISQENSLDFDYATSTQNSDQPGPSNATTSASYISLDDFVLDDGFLSSDDSISRDLENFHKQEQQSIASNSPESDFFGFGDTDFNSSSSDGSAAEDSKKDVIKIQQDQPENLGEGALHTRSDSSEFGESDFNISFSDDSETERKSKAMITSSQQLSNVMPSTSESIPDSAEDDEFTNFKFEVSSSDESEQEDQGVISGNHSELLEKINNTESTASTNGGASLDMENSPSFVINNSDFETSSSEENEHSKSAQENKHFEINCNYTNSINENEMEDRFEQRGNVTPQNKAKFPSDFNNSSFKNHEKQMTTVNTYKEILSPPEHQGVSFDLENNPLIVISDFYVDNQNEMEEDVIEQRDNVHQRKANFTSDFNDLFFKNHENQINISKNVSRHQEKQGESMSIFNASSSEHSDNSKQCANTSRDYLYQKEREITEETSSSSCSLDCGFSNYPEAIVLKLPLRLSIKRTTSANKPGPSIHSSTDTVAQNISDISAGVCKITEVTSCPSGSFQGFGSESIVSSNEVLHPTVDINKTNQSSQDTSVSRDKQVDDISTTNHSSNAVLITFSLIENKSFKLSHSGRMYSYNSFISVKDGNPNSGPTRCAEIHVNEGTSSRSAEKFDVPSNAGHFGHDDVCHACPLKSVANETSSTETLVRNEFKLVAEESGKVIVPFHLSNLFEGRFFIKDKEQLSARKDGALFLNWRKHKS